MKRTIRLTESDIRRIVKSVLMEAAKPSFNLQELSNLRTFSQRVQYCRQNLGMPIGSGSSRLVFQIDDEKVLKLAKNGKGLAQNEYEGTPDYYKAEYNIFPKVYETADDYSWLVSEFVLPAKKQDFKECLGVSFEDMTKAITTMDMMHRNSQRKYRPAFDKEYVWELCNNNRFFYELNDYIGNYDSANINDLYWIRNYGLAQRDGQPWIVILDSGLSEDIWSTHYVKSR